MHCPLAPAPAIEDPASTSPHLPSPESHISQRRILIADDNQDAAQSLAMLLELEGFEVTIAHDGAHALAVFETEQPRFALLDIGMPKIDGYEVARRIRRHARGSAVVLIAVTGWGQATDKARARAAGFDHHLTKPIELEQLSALLADVGREPHLTR
jgi:CheY-like chemotaxis protein